MKFNYEGNSLKSGIYKILNTHNGRVYIGSSARFKARWQDGHAKHLLKGKHQNRFIQADYDKCRDTFGHDDFLEFHVIEVMEGSTKEERKIHEQKWLDQYFDNGKQCYNLKPLASVSREDVPSKKPDVTRERISKRSQEMWASISPEEKERRMQLFQSGKDEKWKRNISKALMGRKLAPEHVDKIKVATIGKKRGSHSEEMKRKMSLGKKNKKKIEAIRLETREASICESITEAARRTQVSVAGVSLVASGKMGSCKGWTFRYLP
jgi:group I intron endonuclease